MKTLVNEADKYALSEIEKYGLPRLEDFNTSNEKGEWLAKKFKANEEIVKIGTRLMDLKLGEAFSKSQLPKHIEMSVDSTKEFLSKFDIAKETKEKIINCVEGHHGTKKWICKEAEICANADCYRFLLIRNWLNFLTSLGKRNTSFEEALKYAEDKVDEKWKILSLEICKQELEPHYKLIKEIIKKAKEK